MGYLQHDLQTIHVRDQRKDMASGSAIDAAAFAFCSLACECRREVSESTDECSIGAIMVSHVKFV